MAHVGAAVASTSASDTKSVKHFVVLVHGAFANVGGRIVGSFWTPGGTEFEQIHVLRKAPRASVLSTHPIAADCVGTWVCEGADRVRLS